MAAKLKHKDSINELYSNLASLYEELVKKYEGCIRQRKQVESNVYQSKKLFRPWPCLNKKEDEKEKLKEITDKKTKSSNVKDERQGDGTEDEQEQPQANPDIELLDKILAKAQRAREIQEKIDAANVKAKVPRKSHTSHDTTTTKGKLLTKPTAKNEKVTNIPNKQQCLPKTVAMVTRSKPTSQPSSMRPVVKQPVLERRNKPAMKTTYGASFGKPSHGRPVSGTGKKSAKDYLDGVLGGNAAKSRITKDTTHHKSENQAPQVPVKNSSKKSMGAQNITESTQCSSKEQTKDSAESLVEQEQEDRAEEEDFVQRAKYELVRISNELKEISSKKEERTKMEQKIDKNEERAPPAPTIVEAEAELVDVKPFILVEDGHTLSLPSKYRKIKSMNTKLVSQIHKKLHETDFVQSETFTRSLENQFDWPNQLKQSNQSNQLSHETLATEVQALMESQHKLLLHATWVIERSVVISSSSVFSWQNVYKCYRHWQVLLGKFRDVQKRAQNLMAAEGYLQRCCPCGGCLTARGLSSHYSNPHNSDQQEYPTTSCCLFSTSQRGKAEEEPSDCVTYTSDKELRKLNEVLHDLQTNELSVEIQRRVGSKALEVLQQLDPSDRLFIPIYRGLWGLVCGQGKAFPSLVLDNNAD